MKFTNLTNAKGETLKEWIIQDQDENTFYLKDPDSDKVFHYPKASFENEVEFSGASQYGDRIIIPMKKSL